MIRPAQNSGKVEIIEALRFLAALCVVFVHIPLVEAGHFGVDAFFVISGYVMMLCTQSSGKQFFLKRLIRIVPAYYLFTLGVFALAWQYPSLLNSTTADLGHLLKSLAFIPFDKNGIGHYPILFLGWTLNYEMYFYLLFAIALKFSHQHRGLLVAVFILLVFSVAQGAGNFVFKVYGNLIVFEFVLGILLFAILSERRSWLQIGGLLAIVLLAVSITGVDPQNRFYIYGLPALGIIYIALRLFASVKMPPSLLTLGGASYALYLSHPYVIQVFDKMTGWFDGSTPERVLALVLSLCLTNLVAVLVYKFMEEPVRHSLRQLMLRLQS